MTISNALLTYAGPLAVLFSAIAWWYAYRAWLFCQDTEDFIKKVIKSPAPAMSKLTEIECEMTELADSIGALHTSLKKLRARVGMRENRAAGGRLEGQIPDPREDPAGYKRAMRLKLGQGKL